MSDSAQITLRQFVEADIPFAMELKNLAKWNQTPADWRGYLAYEPEGCFIAEVDSQPAGSVTTIRYSDRVGWIGMLLVHPNFRRLGIGSKMLLHSIDYLRANRVASIKLDATEMGRKVYVPLGFQDEYMVRRYERAPLEPSLNAKDVEKLTPAIVNRVAEFDAPIFGADRVHVLKILSARADVYSLCIREGNQIRGYLMARKGFEAAQVGPWVADNADVAKELFSAALSHFSGDKIILDVPEPNASAIQIVEAAGFTIQRSFYRMYTGSNQYPGVPSEIYGTSGAEKG
jgi:ribosomal protein S18 acetylase RimI-like enzyme